MLSIVVMLFLLVGFYGLFAGLVFFAESVIEPDSTSARPRLDSTSVTMLTASCEASLNTRQSKVSSNRLSCGLRVAE